LREAKDPLAEWLDKIQGSTVTEHSIFTKLSQHWESEFHKDMDALNVRINIDVNMNNISHRLQALLIVSQNNCSGFKTHCTDKS
jgi:hypothetical protein